MTNLRAKLIAFIALGGGERTEVTCVINRQRMDDTLDVDGESRPFVIQQHQCGRRLFGIFCCKMYLLGCSNLCRKMDDGSLAFN